MVDAIFVPKFSKQFTKIKDTALKRRIIKQIKKLKDNPELGKPMMFERKGTREVYIAPFRLAYVYMMEEDAIMFLSVYHKDEQ